LGAGLLSCRPMPFSLFKKAEVTKKYEFKEQLGSGNFAIVKKALQRKPEAGSEIPTEVAIKIIDKSKVEDMNDITREIEIMDNISHKYIVRLYEIFDESKKMNLVMELVTGGELFDRIVAKEKYTEKDAAKVLTQICEALDYLHSPAGDRTQPIVHRDLKPENILYKDSSDESDIKIADFGLARLVSSKDMMKTACGTPGYVAPEVLQNKGYDSGAVDIWSVGVILYILLCGFPPFYEEALPALFDQILNARYDFPSPWWDKVSVDAKTLVQRMLTLDPKKRATAKDVLKTKWCQGDSASGEDDCMKGAKANLKKYNASRKLKKAAKNIMALNKLSAVAKPT